MTRTGSLLNRSHGRRMSAREFTRHALISRSQVDDFWQIKYDLAHTLAAQYQLPIRQANHLIEQEARKLGLR